MTGRQDVVTADHLLHEGRLASLDLRLVAGAAGVSRTITNPRLQKPGLALAGFLEYVKPGRVQVIGFSEAQFLATLPPATAARAGRGAGGARTAADRRQQGDGADRRRCSPGRATATASRWRSRPSPPPR